MANQLLYDACKGVARVPDRVVRRHGATLIAVMVCLAIITILWGVLIKVALLQQRQQRAAESRMQAEWLAESAIQRAAAQLGLSADYLGETWQIEESELGTGTTAVILIEVSRSDDVLDRRVVRVRADYLRDGERRARFSKEIPMSVARNSTETLQ